MGEDFGKAITTTAEVFGGIVAGGVVSQAFGLPTGFVSEALVNFLAPTINPTISPDAMGGSVPGISDVSSKFSSFGDQGFARTTTSPQIPIPVFIGTSKVYGNLLDYFLLGEDDKRMFAVIGIGHARLTLIKMFIDNKDVTTLPGYIDVDAGETPDDKSPWTTFKGGGGASGDVLLDNSGKKNLGLSAQSGEIVVAPDIFIPNVVSGNNEVRVFISVSVPDVYVDFLETSDADYTGLTGLTLIVDHVRPGLVTVFQETVTFTAVEVDATTVAARINLQTTEVTATVVNIDEIKIESDNADNKLLKFAGTAFAQFNILQQNYGTQISYTLSRQKQNSSILTTIATETDRDVEEIINGQAQRTQVLIDNGGDFFFETSLPSSGVWSFVLEVSKATNAGTVNIAIVEVMSDFVETDNGVFTGIAEQTLIIEINDGTQQTITFGVGTNTAALAIIDINTQLGTSVIASASGSEILIEAVASPVGTKSLAEVKKLKIIGGTAFTAMNFKPLYSETKTYDFPITYAIANIIKTRSISANPQFSFEISGISNNPAEALKQIFIGGALPVNFLNIADQFDLAEVDNSIDFCTSKGFTANIAFTDINFGDAIKILLDSGSLMLIKTGGLYKIRPETDSQITTEFFQTDTNQDNIIKNTFSWSMIDERTKFNVLRVIYVDASNSYISRDLIIDRFGIVDTVNGEQPQIIENGVRINISDSVNDFRREQTLNMPAVTNETQAKILGIQAFQKQFQANLGFQWESSLKDVSVELGDIVSLNLDRLNFIKKKVRVLEISEKEDLGYRIVASEHFSEMYA